MLFISKFFSLFLGMCTLVIVLRFLNNKWLTLFSLFSMTAHTSLFFFFLSQVLLSQCHRFRALVLLGRFLDMGPWAVDLVVFRGVALGNHIICSACMCISRVWHLMKYVMN